jgi:hypothetical protein
MHTGNARRFEIRDSWGDRPRQIGSRSEARAGALGNQIWRDAASIQAWSWYAALKRLEQKTAEKSMLPTCIFHGNDTHTHTHTHTRFSIVITGAC